MAAGQHSSRTPPDITEALWGCSAPLIGLQKAVIFALLTLLWIGILDAALIEKGEIYRKGRSHGDVTEIPTIFQEKNKENLVILC